MLAEIARQATDLDANIEGINLQEKGAHHGVMHISLIVRDRIHLARIIKRMRIIPGVEKIIRVRA
jgi:(p)ppGpp synthase/HD superfamily hydrolase